MLRELTRAFADGIDLHGCLEKFDSWFRIWSEPALFCRRAERVHIASFAIRSTPEPVILSGKDGDDAYHYQEKHVRNVIREVTR